MDKYLVTPRKLLPGGNQDAYPEIKEGDFARMGQNAQAGDKHITADFIRKPGGPVAILGGDYQLAGGLTLHIFKPLRAWKADGTELSDHDASIKVINHSAADPTNARIDLIYVLMEEDKDAGTETRHFKEDPTDPNSLEGDASVAVEKRNVLTITVASGTAATEPQVPALPSNSAPLYVVTIPAGATVLQPGDVLDVRYNFDRLEELYERVVRIEADVNDLKRFDHTHRANVIGVDAPANVLGPSVQDVLNKLTAQNDEDPDDPIFRPEVITPGIAPHLATSGKLNSDGTVEGGLPCVQFPVVNNQVSFFGGAVRRLIPSAFPAVVESVNINARILDTHASAGVQSKDNVINLNLSAIKVISSDGGGDFLLEPYALAAARLRHFFGGRLMAARDATKLELMGGGGQTGDSSWFTIDTVANTVTPRSFTGDVPTFPIIGVFPMGDSTHVLVAELGGAATQNPQGGTLRWYKVNCATGASVRYSVAPGTTGAPIDAGNSYIPAAVAGDLIEPNVIQLIVLAKGAYGADSSARMWVFHVDTNFFEEITPIGQGPIFGTNGFNDSLIGVDLCMLSPGEALVFQGGRGNTTIQPRSFRFTYATRTWTPLQISQPTPLPGNSSTVVAEPSIANIGGRVLLVASNAGLWELTPGQTFLWRALPTLLTVNNGTRGRAGMAGTLLGGLPKGKGFLAGGTLGSSNTASAQVWEFAEGGIIETNCSGATGLALGGGTTQATFEVDSIALPWQVAKVLSVPIGNLPTGSIRIAYDFGNGFVDVPRDRVTTISNSAINPTPKVRITLIGTSDVRPCINKLNELYEQVGGPGLVETKLRFNIPTGGVRYLYIDRDGIVTIEATAQKTTPNKALLMVITPNGVSAPTPSDRVNKRWLHRKYTGSKSGGVDPTFTNDLPFDPSFIKAELVDGSANKKNLADPTVTFNQAVVVTGLANGESFIVELAG